MKLMIKACSSCGRKKLKASDFQDGVQKTCKKCVTKRRLKKEKKFSSPRSGPSGSKTCSSCGVEHELCKYSNGRKTCDRCLAQRSEYSSKRAEAEPPPGMKMCSSKKFCRTEQFVGDAKTCTPCREASASASAQRRATAAEQRQQDAGASADDEFQFDRLENFAEELPDPPSTDHAAYDVPSLLGSIEDSPFTPHMQVVSETPHDEVEETVCDLCDSKDTHTLQSTGLRMPVLAGNKARTGSTDVTAAMAHLSLGISTAGNGVCKYINIVLCRCACRGNRWSSAHGEIREIQPHRM